MIMNDKYDVIIIGGGIGGLCCAYQLIKNNSKDFSWYLLQIYINSMSFLMPYT